MEKAAEALSYGKNTSEIQNNQDQNETQFYGFYEKVNSQRIDFQPDLKQP